MIDVILVIVDIAFHVSAGIDVPFPALTSKIGAKLDSSFISAECFLVDKI